MPINSQLYLEKQYADRSALTLAPTREGFGVGLQEAAGEDQNIVGVCADLTESTRMNLFAEAYPDRFVQVGVAEQNLVTVASGLAAEGKVVFAASYATFSPGRNWEQIRTTICYNDQNVKIVGSHTGLSVGPDGATHQALEDIALMRVLPNMTVVVPADMEEARKATHALALHHSPAYIRLSREKSPVFTTRNTPFTLGKAEVLWKGSDVTLIGCGSVVYEALQAAIQLNPTISVEVINMHTISPLDETTLLRSVRKTGCVVTVEEHQITGGLGGAVAEVLAKKFPAPLQMVGVNNTFGESGSAAELWNAYGLTTKNIIRHIQQAVKRKHL